ncbi:7018_t:CDS:1 [Funneliformis geosporum]|uniref:1017_t:CDS:1 n=1 Tax=Funneliformis geosporum TaxID=1117311 RepID=A0A9W4SK90_9GLOM|nr:1017_t:CDS:1 [Funneliformis geosporum]CAI2174635.1 7018_t:CDS:1 [Funneliformis geosporum]
MELSLKKRYEIVFLCEYPADPRFSFGQIAKVVHCCKSTAIFGVKKYHENRDLSTAERLGQPRITTTKQDKQITKMTEKEIILQPLKYKKIWKNMMLRLV